MLWFVIVMCLTRQLGHLCSPHGQDYQPVTPNEFFLHTLWHDVVIIVWNIPSEERIQVTHVLLKNSFVGLNPALLVSFTNAHFRALPPRPAIFTPSLFILRLTLARKFARILPKKSKK